MKNKPEVPARKREKKKTMRPVLPTILVLAAIIAVSMVRANAQYKIEAYVYDPCGGCFADGIPCKPCTVVLELEQYLGGELKRQGMSENYEVFVGNTLLPEIKEQYLFRIGVWDKGEYPVVFIGDHILYGWDEIRSEFPQILGGKTTSEQPPQKEPQTDFQSGVDLFVYFKLPSCGQCAEAEELFDRLEQKGVPSKRLTYDVESEFGLFERYCQAYGADSETLCLPAVFVGDSVLEGYEEIEMFLEEYLGRGDGMKTLYASSDAE